MALPPILASLKLAKPDLRERVEYNTSTEESNSYRTGTSRGIEPASPFDEYTPSLGSLLGLAVTGATVFALKKNWNSLSFAKKAHEFLGDPKAKLDNSGTYSQRFLGITSDLDLIRNHFKVIGRQQTKPLIADVLNTDRLPKLPSGSTYATIGDLAEEFRSRTNIEQESSDLLRSIVSDTARLSHGASEADVLKTPLGKNILKVDGQLVDYSGYTGKGLTVRALEWARDNLKVPFVDFAPTNLLMSKAWGHARSTAILDPGVKVGKAELTKGGIFFNKKIYTSDQTIDAPGVKIIRTDTDLYKSIQDVTKQSQFRSLEELHQTGGQGFLGDTFINALLKTKQKVLGKGSLSSTQKIDPIRNALASLIEDFPISPKYRQDKSIGTNIKNWFKRFEAEPILTGSRDLDATPLTAIEKWKLKHNFDVPGHQYVETEKAQRRRIVREFDYDDTDPRVTKAMEQAPKVIGASQRGRKGTGLRTFVEGVDSSASAITLGQGKKVVVNDYGIVDSGGSVIEKSLTSDLARGVMHQLLERPHRILEAFTGLGVKPASTVTGQLLTGTIGMFAASSGAFMAAKYADFLLYNTPSKLAAVAAGTGQVATQAAFDITGVSTVTEELETMLPGSVDSLASQFLRVGAAPFIGAAFGRSELGSHLFSKLGKLKFNAIRNFAEKVSGKEFKEAMSNQVVGAVTATALALSTVLLDPSKGAAQQYSEATGESRVAIKKARWWVAGRSPFEGEDIKYFDASWVQKLYHHPATDISRYGSQAAMFAHSALPTPTNLFGLVPLVDPYYAERRDPGRRPYPHISGAGENIPILGPLISRTVGQIVKPSLNYEFEGDSLPGVGEYGPEGASEALGFKAGDASGAMENIEAGGGVEVGAHRSIGALQDFTGIYGFGAKFALSALTGSETGLAPDYQLESSAYMTDASKDISDWNLGGFMGATEYARRIFGGRSTDVTYVNPMANTMPKWLPGSDSIFEGDIKYREDFSKGDPMGRLEGGEYRLPGAGMKEMYGYHGGDDLDAVDMFSILADVAPGSQARKFYQNIVEQDIQEGRADNVAIEIYNQRRSEMDAKLTGSYTFTDYGNSVLDESDDQLSRTREVGNYATQLGSVLGDSELSNSMKEYLGYANLNIEGTESSGLGPIRSAWDAVTHTQVPGLAWLQGKFMHKRTPLEEYVASQVHSTNFADWMNPFEGFVRPAFTETVGALAGSSYIPSHVQQGRDVEEYYDKIKYLKARRLEQEAEVIGDEGLAKRFKNQQLQTVVGMDYNPASVNKNLFQALPSNVRPFAVGFSKSSPEEAQKILDYVPEYQRDLWENIFRGNLVAPGEVDTQDPTLRADQEVAEYFGNHALPDEQSGIWNPDYELDEYKLKTAEWEGVSSNMLGIPQAKVREYKSLGRADVVIDTSSFSDDQNVRNGLLRELSMAGNHSARVRMSHIRRNSHIKYDDSNYVKRYKETADSRF